MLNGVCVRPKGLRSASLFHLPTLVTILASGLLLGCAVTTEPALYSHDQQPQALPERFHHSGQWQAISAQTTEHSTTWQYTLDPELTQLLAQIAAENPSVQSLNARYRAALASLKQTESTRLPTANLSASQTTGTLSSSSSLTNNGLSTADVYQVGMSVNWEIDLWGKIDQQRQSQMALLTASQADWQAGILSAQVLAGQSYVHIEAITQHTQLMQQIAQEQKRFILLTQARHRAGVATRLDVAQAETQYHNSELRLLELRAQLAQKCTALAVLSGQTEASTRNCLSSPNARPNQQPLAPTPHLIPSDLLTQRPDIQAQLARVMAANAHLGYTQTAFLPTLSLTASVNSRSQDWRDLFDLPNAIWSLGPALAHTLFDGGKRQAITEQAQADYERTIADYRQVVLTAFEEVEQNLITANMIEQAIDIQQKAIASAKTALQIAQSQYRAGTADALTVISAQTQFWQAESGMIDLWLRHWQAYFVLIKQVGVTAMMPPNDSPSTAPRRPE